MVYSQCTRSLVELLLGNEYGFDMATKEEAYTVFVDVLEITEKKDKVMLCLLMNNELNVWNYNSINIQYITYYSIHVLQYILL